MIDFYVSRAMFTSMFMNVLNVLIQFLYILHHRRFHRQSISYYQSTIADLLKKNLTKTSTLNPHSRNLRGWIFIHEVHGSHLDTFHVNNIQHIDILRIKYSDLSKKQKRWTYMDIIHVENIYVESISIFQGWNILIYWRNRNVEYT